MKKLGKMLAILTGLVTGGIVVSLPLMLQMASAAVLSKSGPIGLEGVKSSSLLIN